MVIPVDSMRPVASGSSTQRRPQIAEPFVDAEVESLTEDEPRLAVTASSNSARTQPVTIPLISGSPVSEKAGRPIASPSPQASSVALGGQSDQPIVDTVVARAIPRQEERPMPPVITDAMDFAPPVTGSTPTLTNAPSITSSRPEAPPAPTSSVTLPELLETLDLRQNNWGRVLGQQLNWLVNNQMQEAEIRVNPPELGPLAIRMSLHQNQTNITFFCHEAAVREAIENALPRLREMLDSQGIYLNQAQVSDQPMTRQQTGEQAAYQQPRDGRPPAPTRKDQELPEEAKPQPRQSLSGGVDDYA